MKSDIQIAQEAEMLPIKEVAEKLGIGEDDLELYGKYKAKIEKLDTSNIDISSQMIRSWLNAGKPIRYYVPDAVVEYIQKRNLYRGCETDEVL